MNNAYKKSGADYASSYTEHLVKKEVDKLLAFKRVAIILLALLLLIGVLILTFKVPYYSVIALVLIFFALKYLWGFTVIEFEYLIVSNTFSVDKIYATRKRRQVTEFKVSTAEAILPFRDTLLEKVDTVHFTVSKKNAPDAYLAIYKNESGEREGVVFNANKKMLDMLKYYNRTTVINDEIM